MEAISVKSNESINNRFAIEGRLILIAIFYTVLASTRSFKALVDSESRRTAPQEGALRKLLSTRFGYEPHVQIENPKDVFKDSHKPWGRKAESVLK